MATKSKRKAVKTTTARSPANATSDKAPTQTTNAAVGGGGANAGNPPKKKKNAKEKEKGDPVGVVSGQVVENTLDVDLPGPVAFAWWRRYERSRCGWRGPLGRGGWTHDYHQWIEPIDGGWRVVDHFGEDVDFGAPVGGVAYHRGKQLELQVAGDTFVVRDVFRNRTYEYRPLVAGGAARLVGVADRYGNRIVLEHDGERLVRIVDCARRLVHVLSDDEGRIVALELEVEGRRKRLFAYRYDDEGRLAAARDALDQPIRYAYDGLHRLIGKTLRNGFTVHYEYDPIVDRVAKTYGGGDLHHVEFTYDLEKRTTITHAEPQPRVFVWDERENLVLEQTYDGRLEIERTYDGDDLLLTETNAAGEAVEFAHDARGHLARVVDAAGNETRYEHVDDLLRRVVRPDGLERRYEHDGFGGLSGVTLETGARYTVDRDRWGHIVAHHGPDGLIERLEWDERHQLVRRLGPRGQATIYAYDDEGRPVARTDALGRTTHVRYDAAGNVVALTYPDGVTVEVENDPLGNPTRIVKPGGELRMRYEGTGSLRRFEEENGGVWSIDVDREEKPVRLVNPKGERWDFRYDRAGRVVEERTFDGRTVRYGYDLAGRVRRVDHADDTWIEYSYDPLDNVLVEDSPHGTATFERDALGRVLQATLDEGPVVSTVTFERDRFGRVIAETQDGLTTRHAWDAENRRIERVAPNGETTRYHYDLESNLAAVEHQGVRVDLDRDVLGREARRVIGGGAAVLHTTYDARDRLVGQEVTRPSAHGAGVVETLVRRRWERDGVGRPMRLEDARWGVTDFFHDRANRLTSQRHSKLDEVFDHDPAGAVVRALRGTAEAPFWTVREGDLVTRAEDHVFEYDARNRRTKRTRVDAEGQPLEVTTYAWDCRDRLREVRLPDGSVARYFYDAYGRRTRKVVAPPPSGALEALARGEVPPAAAPPRVVRLAWDGHAIASEIDADAGTRVFVHEDGTLRPLLQSEQGEVFTYVLDDVGTPRELLDAGGEVAWTARYLAWGQIADEQRGRPRARPLRSPFRLLGQYADDETGLCSTRYRFFDPAIARWLSPDPIGVKGGAGPFQFDGAPTFESDPLGLTPLDQGGFFVYRIANEDGTYYVGITNDYDRRKGEHTKSGRIPDYGGSMSELHGDLTYAKARGYEQAYIEFYGTRPANQKGEFPGNEINSFRHGREDDRGKAFQEAYEEKMAQLEKTAKAQAKQK